MVAVLTSKECFTFIICWTGPNNGSFKCRHSKVQVKTAGKFKEAMALLSGLLTQRPQLRDDFCFLAFVTVPKPKKVVSLTIQTSALLPVCPDFSHPSVFCPRQKSSCFSSLASKALFPRLKSLQLALIKNEYIR